MGVASWPFEPETLETFADALGSVREVVGEPVIVRVRAPGSRQTVSMFGRLEQPTNQPEEGVLFRVGQKSYFTLYEELFVRASRHSIDSGSFWGLTISQAGVDLCMSEDKNASR
jgi:hypothetical protein